MPQGLVALWNTAGKQRPGLSSLESRAFPTFEELEKHSALVYHSELPEEKRNDGGMAVYMG